MSRQERRGQPSFLELFGTLRLTMLTILILIITLISGVHADANSLIAMRETCNDHETCLDMHLRNPALIEFLSKSRCNMTDALLHHQYQGCKLVFTHIPKAGGTTVAKFLEYAFIERYYMRDDAGRPKKEHQDFMESDSKTHKSAIFTTIIRNPIDRALSLWNYIGSFAEFPNKGKNNPLWALTKQFDPNSTQALIEWAAEPFVQQWIHNETNWLFSNLDSNEGFHKNLFGTVNLQDPVDYVASAPVEIYNHTLPWLALSEEVYTEYLAGLPQQFRCKHHITAAQLLLRRYAAVGTLERLDDFWDVLFWRSNLDHTQKEKAKTLHVNTSMRKITLTEEEKAEFAHNLEEGAYCEKVLWRIADMISTQDMVCLAETSVSS